MQAAHKVATLSMIELTLGLVRQKQSGAGQRGSKGGLKAVLSLVQSF